MCVRTCSLKKKTGNPIIKLVGWPSAVALVQVMLLLVERVISRPTYSRLMLWAGVSPIRFDR